MSKTIRNVHYQIQIIHQNTKKTQNYKNKRYIIMEQSQLHRQYKFIILSESSMSLLDFVVLKKIGEGSYSSVHKVKRISDGNIYALKKVKIINLKEKQKQNALNEVRLLASISNQFIIGYKQAFFDQKTNTLCMVLEYADGGDLQKFIEKRKISLHFFKESQIWTIIKQITTGLSLLHEMNIIHRDLKSANIFISNGTYKLGDLNVSKLLKKQMAYTQTGTPYYASPQVWKDQPYQLKSDIWSLGCIIYEICALKHPFTASSLEGLFKKVSKGNYSRIPTNYSQKLQNFIEKCIQLNSKKRPTAKQLLKMIPQNIQNGTENNEDRESYVNLLSTIKVPRHPQKWREDLPKPNYINTNKNQNHNKSISQSTNKFSIHDKERLRQIIKQKNHQSQLRKQYKQAEDLRKQSRSIINITPIIEPQSITNNKRENVASLIRINQENKKYQILPRIKIHSQPIQNIHQSINYKPEIKKYQPYRPAWWG